MELNFDQPLKIKEKFSYGVGHVLNDLCASMWFSYLLIFFHEILQFSHASAGYLLLIGQIADGISTPLVGLESDNSIITCSYGRRKSWHLFGSVCVAFTFPLIFIHCAGCNSASTEISKFVYYAPLIVIFQFGWAATQINHLALIPELARNDGDKVALNAIRYTFTVVSSITVYALAWAYLDVQGTPSSKLCPDDAYAFRNLVLTVVGIGILFSTLFHIGLKEPSKASSSTEPSLHCSVESKPVCSEECTPLLQKKTSLHTEEQLIISWKDWFKIPIFYVNAVLYMCTRLVVNLSQVYLPMFLIFTLQLHKTYIAIIPLVVFVASFIAAVLVRPITKCVPQEVMYVSGGFLVVGACVWVRFMCVHDNTQIFGAASLLGVGTSVILVMSLSMTSRLIGKEVGTSAFVYGAMSLTDKLSNGIAVAVIQNMNPCSCDCPLCSSFFRSVMTYAVGGAMVVGLMMVLVHRCVMRKSTQHLLEQAR